METVTIKAINRTPRTSRKSGKPFISVGIKTEEHGDKWLSGFGDKANERWLEGDQVEIEVEENGEYLNFSMPKRDQSPAAQTPGLAEIKNILTLKILPLLIEIRENQGGRVDYPEYDEKNQPPF